MTNSNTTARGVAPGLTPDIQARLDEVEPDIEVLLVEEPGVGRLRVYIDHPEGVDLSLCERVSRHLQDLVEDYALEVSSPGLDRPLTKPEHFRRFMGQRASLRTREPIEGRRNFQGTLSDADDRSVSLELDDGPVTISLDDIHRSNLVPDPLGDTR